MTSPLVREVVGMKANFSGCADLGQEHELVTILTGSHLIQAINICQICSWIDTEYLDATAANIVKRAVNERATRIAMAVESEPFSFHQSSGEDLPLQEILVQALAAATQMGIESADDNFDHNRAGAILRALSAEVERAMEAAMDRRERAVREELSR